MSKNNDKYVRKSFCDEREKRIFDKLGDIEKKLDSYIALKKELDEKIELLKNSKYSALRTFGYSLLGGIIVATTALGLRLLG